MAENLKNVVFKEGVITIDSLVFGWCLNLTSVTLPSSVRYIDESAFFCCPYLTITVQRYSYAAKYCGDNNLNYTYPDANDWLNN